MNLPAYNFRLVEEAAWTFAITAAIFVGTAFVATDDLTDWRTWLVGVGLGGARSGVGAVLALLTKPAP